MRPPKLSRKLKKQMKRSIASFWIMKRSGKVFPISRLATEGPLKPFSKKGLLRWAKNQTHLRTNMLLWRVAFTKIGGIEVSTVFLGLNHSFSLKGPPLLFETMVFGGEHDGACLRYPTRKQAGKGHKGLVAMVKESLNART